jgi:hypothetical protein
MLNHHTHPRTMWLLPYAVVTTRCKREDLAARSDPSLSKLSFDVLASLWRAPFLRSLARLAAVSPPLSGWPWPTSCRGS